MFSYSSHNELYLSVVSKQPLLNAFCDREVIRYLALGAKITI